MTDTPRTEDEWLTRAARGDRQACQILVERHLPGVFRFSRRMLRSEQDAEDVAQETFLRLWKTADRFEGRSALRTWLFRVAHNLCIDQLRRRREVALDESHDAPTSQPGPLRLIAQRERAESVRRAIEALPERQRAAITLVHHEGLPQSEAADVLGVSVDALESLLSRGRRALRKALLPTEDAS